MEEYEVLAVQVIDGHAEDSVRGTITGPILGVIRRDYNGRGQFDEFDEFEDEISRKVIGG